MAIAPLAGSSVSAVDGVHVRLVVALAGGRVGEIDGARYPAEAEASASEGWVSPAMGPGAPVTLVALHRQQAYSRLAQSP